MSVSIRIHGDERIIRKVRNTRFVNNEFYGATVKSAAALTKRAQTYPRQRPGSSYRRTGRLGRGWAFRINRQGSRYIARILNPVEYAPDVQSVIHQHTIHKGRWPTDRAMLKEQKQKIVGFYQAAARNIRKRFNSGQ